MHRLGDEVGAVGAVRAPGAVVVVPVLVRVGHHLSVAVAPDLPLVAGVVAVVGKRSGARRGVLASLVLFRLTAPVIGAANGVHVGHLRGRRRTALRVGLVGRQQPGTVGALGELHGVRNGHFLVFRSAVRNLLRRERKVEAGTLDELKRCRLAGDGGVSHLHIDLRLRVAAVDFLVPLALLHQCGEIILHLRGHGARGPDAGGRGSGRRTSRRQHVGPLLQITFGELGERGGVGVRQRSRCRRGRLGVRRGAGEHKHRGCG